MVPWRSEEFDLTLKIWSIGVERAAIALISERPGHGVNAKAVMIVEEAQRIWNQFSKRPAPKKKLNPTSPFERFLEQLFLDVEVGAQPDSAFNAWVRATNDPRSVLCCDGTRG